MVLLFPEGGVGEHDRADLETIHRLLQIRALLTETGKRCRIVTEILDDRNLELADVAMPDDAVVSDRLVSLYCLQLSMQPHLEPVFAELLDSEGVEVSLHPIERYLKPGTESDFHEAIDAASRQGATAIAARCGSGSSSTPRRTAGSCRRRATT